MAWTLHAVARVALASVGVLDRIVCEAARIGHEDACIGHADPRTERVAARTGHMNNRSGSHTDSHSMIGRMTRFVPHCIAPSLGRTREHRSLTILVQDRNASRPSCRKAPHGPVSTHRQPEPYKNINQNTDLHVDILMLLEHFA